MTFKSLIQPLCRYCGKPIAKKTEIVRVYDKEPKTSYQDDEVVRTAMGIRKTGRKITRRYEIGRYIVGTFTAAAEAQKLVNDQVVSIRYFQEMKDGRVTGKKLIDHLTVWDGESYKDRFFCSGSHAQLFAYVAAQNRDIATPASYEAGNGSIERFGAKAGRAKTT
jgi:hypothetical protein